MFCNLFLGIIVNLLGNPMLIRFLLLTIIFISNFYATENLKTVNLQLQWKIQYEFAGFYMAKEKGFYKDVNLDVNF